MASPPLKLVTYEALFRAQKVIIIAEMAGVALDIDTQCDEKMLDSLSVHGKVPCLVTPEGNLSESNAISRYIARLADPKKGILGASPYQAALIDAWMDWCVQDLEIPATLWIAPLLGWMEENPAVKKRASEDLRRGMGVLDKHLKNETYVVGNKPTMADVTLFCTLLLPLKLVIEEKGAKKQFPNLMRWYDLVANLQAVLDVVGVTMYCQTALVAAAPSSGAATAAEPKKQQQPKKEKAAAAAPKRKQEATEEALVAEPKKVDPFAGLPETGLNLDAWKREYSNAPGGDTRLAMPWFWENVDLKGYSLWFCNYKHNDECKITFMTSNLVAGFVQRSDAVRKYAFGVMQITGTDSAQKVLGAWLIRGQSIQPLLAENDDAEYYEWIQFTDTPENKARLELIWTAEEEIAGEKVLDGKVFK